MAAALSVGYLGTAAMRDATGFVQGFTVYAM
jgi:hypothetical protein